jgi:hypothetical protein
MDNTLGVRSRQARRHVSPYSEQCRYLHLPAANHVLQSSSLQILRGYERSAALLSVRNIVQAVTMVKSSAVDEDGNEIYPYKWNFEFALVPTVENQRTPPCSRVKKSPSWWQRPMGREKLHSPYWRRLASAQPKSRSKTSCG